jgi:hypothetical protein
VRKKTFCAFLVVFSSIIVPRAFGTRQRAVVGSPAITRESILKTCIAVERKAAAREPINIAYWGDALYITGKVRLGVAENKDIPGSGQADIDAVAQAIGTGRQVVTDTDGGAYGQPAMEIYAITPESDTARRSAMLAALNAPLAFAKHALRDSPLSGALPQYPYWKEDGYGMRFWVDDYVMTPTWLARLGSTKNGLPGNAEARDLAWEWNECLIRDHRPQTDDASARSVPTERTAHGFLLWNPKNGLFEHSPPEIDSENPWGRGVAWGFYGISDSEEYLEDQPYAGTQYVSIVTREELRSMLRRTAETLLALQRPDGGWPSNLGNKSAPCAGAETSATALNAYVMARKINSGLLDRKTYAPRVMRAWAFIQSRVDVKGDVADVQPPGIGPDCNSIVNSGGSINVRYATGGILLLGTEIMKFPDEDIHQ